MKRAVALLLSIMMLLTGCGQVQSQTTAASESGVTAKPAESVESTADPVVSDEAEPQYDSLDNELLCVAGDTIYTELIQKLDPDMFQVEEIKTAYVSKEYLEEVEYNSQSNIFFGYSLADLDAQFQRKRYVFTLDENGQTCVQELIEVEDETCDEIVKNVAIGSGVILACVTVAILTKNPANVPKASDAIKIIFVASCRGAKTGTKLGLIFSAIGGTASAIIEAIQTGDVKETLEAGLVGASEGFKFGAIFGTVKGIADGIKIVGNSRFFPSGSEQALKYPEGVEFTQAADGASYPRFEKWAKATAKFDIPSLDTALNHTGLSGNYYWDAKLANAQCGFNQTPAGYVWHHVEDMKTMILVPQDLHSVAMGGMSHTGGASLIRAFLGLT